MTTGSPVAWTRSRIARQRGLEVGSVDSIHMTSLCDRSYDVKRTLLLSRQPWSSMALATPAPGNVLFSRAQPPGEQCGPSLPALTSPTTPRGQPARQIETTSISWGSSVGEIAVPARRFRDSPLHPGETFRTPLRAAFFSFIFCYSNRGSLDIYLPLTQRDIRLIVPDGRGCPFRKVDGAP